MYRFALNDDRDSITINNTFVGDIESLSDNEVDTPKESEPIIFAQGFGGITDIKTGPDGYLYILTYTGNLYRILPVSESSQPKNQPSTAAQNNAHSDVPSDAIPAKIVGISGGNSYSPNPIEIKAGQTVYGIMTI